MTAPADLAAVADRAAVLDRARVRARADAIDRARELTRDLTDAIDRAIDRACDHNNRALIDDLTCAREFASGLHRDLVSTLNFDLHLVSTFQLYCARNLVRILNRTCARTLVSDLRRVRARILRTLISPLLDDLGRTRTLISDLTCARESASALDLDLDLARNRKRVASSAAGLLAAATRLLPAADRARYGEEYACELRELAQTGCGRLGQVRYALCQLRSAPQMRLALRSRRRRSAVP